MSYYLDVKYLNMVSCRLDGFTQKSNELYNCRCFLCMDSSKKKSKKRGYFFRKNNDMFYHCHNCGQGMTFYNFLNHVDPSVAKEYSVERFSQGESGHHNYKKPKVIASTKPVFKSKEKLNLPTIQSLPEDNIAKKYVEARKIPSSKYFDLYYAEDFKKFVDELMPNHDKILFENDKRLIIPFRDKFGKITAIQGRSLTNSKLRYITIKTDKEFYKVYGVDKVDLNKLTRVVEGPIDSMFLDNCIATADANLSSVKSIMDNINNFVLIFDNEPRNSNLIKQIEKAAKDKFRVCLLPESFKYKDINEAILDGLTKEQIQDIINKNTFEGLRLDLELMTWRKI